MKTSMLDYSKLILKKVSFNKKLFWKEYRKFNIVLDKKEQKDLKDWIRQSFFNDFSKSQLTKNH